MSIHLRFNANPSKKIPADDFAENNELILKFIWKCEMPRVAKTIFKKKNKIEDLHLLISILTIKLYS